MSEDSIMEIIEDGKVIARGKCEVTKGDDGIAWFSLPKMLTKTELDLYDALRDGPVPLPEVAADAKCFRVHICNIRRKMRQHGVALEIVAVKSPTQYTMRWSDVDDDAEYARWLNEIEAAFAKKATHIDDGLKIKVLVEGNPRHESGKVYKRVGLYFGGGVKTVGDYISKSGVSRSQALADLQWDIDRGFIKVG